MNAAPEPSPAPATPRRDQSYSVVLFSGAATSALTLLGVYLLNEYTEDFNIMGWYADQVIPVGALIVGVVASSGYGLASWFSGVKITKTLLLAVLAFQLTVYFAAQYMEFSHQKLVHLKDRTPVGFFEYYDFMARSIAWQSDNGKPGEPLGLWGYAVRGLEILGFVGGSLIVPAILLKAPYCQVCQRYMRSRQISLLAASVPAKKIKKTDAEGQAAYKGEQEAAFANGKRLTEILQQMSAAGQAAEFRQTLAGLEPAKKQAAKLPLRISLHLVTCKKCQSGWLLSKLLAGQGKQIKITEMAKSDVTPDFVRAVQL